jgi:hypothetical protein
MHVSHMEEVSDARKKLDVKSWREEITWETWEWTEWQY